MEQISNRALISRLFSSAEQRMDAIDYNSNNWRDWYSAVQDLTIPEKMVYVLVKLNQTVTNGGFSEFYESSIGIFAPEIIHALTEIKADASANIVSSSLPVVNPSELLDDDYKNFMFNVQLSAKQKTDLYAQDVLYDQLQDQENLEDLLGSYLQKFINT